MVLPPLGGHIQRQKDYHLLIQQGQDHHLALKVPLDRISLQVIRVSLRCLRKVDFKVVAIPGKVPCLPDFACLY